MMFGTCLIVSYGFYAERAIMCYRNVRIPTDAFFPVHNAPLDPGPGAVPRPHAQGSIETQQRQGDSYS